MSEPRPRHPLATRFVDALGALESDGGDEQVAAIAELFAADAVLRRIAHGHDEQGRAGAREFWAGYRGTFDIVASTFHGLVEDERSVALEWSAQGRLAGGSPIEYEGVSVLDLGDEQLRGFRTYYDTAAFITAAKAH